MLKKIGIFAIILLCLSGCSSSPSSSNEMDVYNSRTIAFENGYIEDLTIIVNKKHITDYEECAKEIIKKYINNEYQSMIFSFDFGYPAELNATVFLSENDIDNSHPIFEMTYSQEFNTYEYNIKDNPEKFHIEITSF
ncbi:hypothetical protein H6A64_13295 [Lacrimispora saccharolytica]|nr:hypothetical protein [Lacrimispora saccharolytica]